MTAEEAQHHPWLSKVEGLSLSMGGPQQGTGIVPIDEVLLLRIRTITTLLQCPCMSYYIHIPWNGSVRVRVRLEYIFFKFGYY